MRGAYVAFFAGSHISPLDCQYHYDDHLMSTVKCDWGHKSSCLPGTRRPKQQGRCQHDWLQLNNHCLPTLALVTSPIPIRTSRLSHIATRQPVTRGKGDTPYASMVQV
jgi:hypothetical protein